MCRICRLYWKAERHSAAIQYRHLAIEVLIGFATTWANGRVNSLFIGLAPHVARTQRSTSRTVCKSLTCPHIYLVEPTLRSHTRSPAFWFTACIQPAVSLKNSMPSSKINIAMNLASSTICPQQSTWKSIFIFIFKWVKSSIKRWSVGNAWCLHTKNGNRGNRYLQQTWKQICWKFKFWHVLYHLHTSGSSYLKSYWMIHMSSYRMEQILVLDK